MRRSELEAKASAEQAAKADVDYYGFYAKGYIAGFLAGKNAAAEILLKRSTQAANDKYAAVADMMIFLKKEIEALGEEK